MNHLTLEADHGRLAVCTPTRGIKQACDLSGLVGLGASAGTENSTKKAAPPNSTREMLARS